MKKNIFMASLVATLLVGVLFVINQTHAQTATLSLSVTAWYISCTAATGIDLWGSPSGTTTQTISGNAWVGPDFWCTDLKGDTGWNYTISSSSLSGTPGWSIAASNIMLTPSWAITISSWSCASVTTGAGWALDTPKNLIAKSSGYGQTCAFYLTNTQAKITITIPAWSPIGNYSSTITIIYPS